MKHAPLIDLKRPYIESSSHSAVNKSFTVAIVRLLSRAATRPTLVRMCLETGVSIRSFQAVRSTYSHMALTGVGLSVRNIDKPNEKNNILQNGSQVQSRARQENSVRRGHDVLLESLLNTNFHVGVFIEFIEC